MRKAIEDLGIVFLGAVVVVSLLLNVFFLTFTNPELKRVEEAYSEELMRGARMYGFIASLADAQIATVVNAPDWTCTDATTVVAMPPTVPLEVSFQCVPKWSKPSENEFHISRWFKSKEFKIEYSIHSPWNRAAAN